MMDAGIKAHRVLVLAPILYIDTDFRLKIQLVVARSKNFS